MRGQLRLVCLAILGGDDQMEDGQSRGAAIEFRHRLFGRS